LSTGLLRDVENLLARVVPSKRRQRAVISKPVMRITVLAGWCA
jgi:hypothetical protein